MIIMHLNIVMMPIYFIRILITKSLSFKVKIYIIVCFVSYTALKKNDLKG